MIFSIEKKSSQLELISTPPPSSTEGAADKPRRLHIILDPIHRLIQLQWRATTDTVLLRVTVKRSALPVGFGEVDWETEDSNERHSEFGMGHPSSIRAQLKRYKESWPVSEGNISAGVATGGPSMDAVKITSVTLPEDISPWQWLARAVVQMLKSKESFAAFTTLLLSAPETREPRPRLVFRLNFPTQCIEIYWSVTGRQDILQQEFIRCTGRNQLTWTRHDGNKQTAIRTPGDAGAIATRLETLRAEVPVLDKDITLIAMYPKTPLNPDGREEVCRLPRGQSPWDWLTGEIQMMSLQCSNEFIPEHIPEQLPPDMYELPTRDPFEHAMRRLEKAERQQREQAERLEQRRIEILRERERREQARLKREQERASRQVAAPNIPAPSLPSARVHAPLPPISIVVAPPEFQLQETMLPLTDLRSYFLRERAAQWWVSNQTDNLLCLPFCRIEQLEYQTRTALRVLGPLRGRALLSDEVGLGKTIEAGLVLKELLTRGMAKRFLVLTVPSLVDQWQEELSEKFNLQTVTTNEAISRANSEKFWSENRCIVASLHTLKQPTHLSVAQTMHWDVLIVDEAHYLRNRTSQAWQAVNTLPRQFLLLLTATPVQNSIEELYNLVTLLQPGQLPSPKEFRARFIDPERPHQPREADELRRLLGQVMVRNTRANAGINLPPRRAETVSFDPNDGEREFWSEWEKELREALAALPANQSALWGRLLLQSAGSSPSAWREVLQSFPRRDLQARWLERAPSDASWHKKCALLEPLTRGEGGVVIFTQFLQTQMALAQKLRTTKTPVFVINGQTPAETRHPITEEFRKHGGALLLTHSGTEGRNLQFCYRLVNFDLPWNPMEIEQRIGRLHRLGQKHPVRIYNFVQTGTLQEHLLQILQEKLNLFELVVGETGLILGDRFTSDEFAEEVLRRWRESEGNVGEAMQSLGDELAAARQGYEQVKQLDETLFAKDYESM